MSGAGRLHAADAGTEVVVYSLQIATDGWLPYSRADSVPTKRRDRDP
jgi:hypothetical protein